MTLVAQSARSAARLAVRRATRFTVRCALPALMIATMTGCAALKDFNDRMAEKNKPLAISETDPSAATQQAQQQGLPPPTVPPVAPAAEAPQAAPEPAAPPPEAAPAKPLRALTLQAGTYQCELNRRLSVRKVGADDEKIVLHWANRDHTLASVDARSGALRYEDSASGLAFIVIVGKALLLDTKKGQQLANECRVPA